MFTNPIDEWIKLETRRQFFGKAGKGLGMAALASLLSQEADAKSGSAQSGLSGGALGQGHFPGKATGFVNTISISL